MLSDHFALTRQSRAYFFRSGLIDQSDETTQNYFGAHINVPLLLFLASDSSAGLTGKMLKMSPDKLVAGAPLRISEIYIGVTGGATSDNWTPSAIAEALPDIMKR